jgi:hypothetical protein
MSFSRARPAPHTTLAIALLLFAPLALSRSYFGTTPYYLAGARSHSYAVPRDTATRRDTVIDRGGKECGSR